MTPAQDVSSLLVRCLRAAGATRAFAASGRAVDLPGFPVVEVGDPGLATLLADADGRLAGAPGGSGPRPGVALLPGRRLRLSSEPGREVLAQPVLDAGDVPLAIASWTAGQVHAAVELELDVDLTALVPDEAEPLVVAPANGRLVTLSPSLATMRTALVVGPGVVRSGALEGVAEAADRTGAGVAATPGAGGALGVDDPAWLGVVGLQRDDAGLAGLADAELVVVAGLDPVEARGVLPDTAQILEVEPWHLGLMAMRWPDPSPRPTSSPSALVGAIAELAAAGRARNGVPLHPARAVSDLADVLGPDELVLADAGRAGLWLARGLVTRPAGSVVVPGLPAPGAAAAGALVAGLDGRPALAVVDAGPDPATEAVLDLAASLDVALTCEVWGADVGWSSATEHREHLVGARHEGGVQRLPVPVDLAATADLEDRFGPVTAWGGEGVGPGPGA